MRDNLGLRIVKSFWKFS